MWKRLFGGKKTRQEVVIVSGLPRSGTSMMMRMLEAGGLGILTDHVRTADEDNPNGYYEFEAVKKVKEDAKFLDQMQGKVVKMVSMLLRDLPSYKHYKIIFMRRHLAEVLRSQSIMLSRNAQKSSSEDDDAEMASIFEKHLADTTLWLQNQPHMDVLYIDYSDVLSDPLTNAQAVNRFLGNRLDVKKMVAVVDQNLYRNRASEA